MAYPRVFISSTCYDLKEIRDTLFEFIDGINYIPVLSDKGDVFYHPDIHTHDSCVHEIETCQLFILIIGGRFGGSYKADPAKSIVNAEYEAAIKLDLPIITFITRDVYEDHRVYVRNRKDNPDNFQDIIYPSIENQKHSIRIFEFIDLVRKADYNNAVFPFDFGREIRKNLKQQWAGMFFDFLRTRKQEKQIKQTNNLLKDLSLISEKTEEILGKVYLKVDEENAGKEMQNIEVAYNAKKFLVNLKNAFPELDFNKINIKKYINIKDNSSMIEFLLETGNFRLVDDSYKSEGRKFKNLFLIDNSFSFLITTGQVTDEEKKRFESFKYLFNDYCKVSKSFREELIESMK